MYLDIGVYWYYNDNSSDSNDDDGGGGGDDKYDGDVNMLVETSLKSEMLE